MSHDESFITPEEYGQELYRNPRGIGCIKCHGETGQGRVIATYKEKGQKKTIIGPNITHLDFETFKTRTLLDRGVMPKYHLTDEELRAIFFYIQELNKKKSLK